MSDGYLQTLIKKLVQLPTETEWLEFKENKAIPQNIGEYISAISNSSALHNQEHGYIVWGIKDDNHEIVGTSFKPFDAKIGNEELINWLTTQLRPSIDFSINEIEINSKHIVIIEIPRAVTQPVRFRGEAYIRNGSYKKNLKTFVEKERKLWKIFDRRPFERLIAQEHVSSDDILRLIDYPAYFELTDQPLPDNRAGILAKLKSEKFIFEKCDGFYDITNLGAILFARNLEEFDYLKRKAIRVIIYKSNNKTETIREQPGVKGFAVGFEGAVNYINDQLPQNEVIENALRSEVRMYPEVAIRELVANAIIHQDFSLSGTSPMVEIFSDRIEITNPGIPLIDTLRFIDEPPRSRNETLASFMRRINICEERGSGMDKVISSVEMFQLPAPDISVTSNHTKVVLFAHKAFADMDRNDRIRACYQHAVLKYVSNERMTNTSLRTRLSIDDKNYPMASRVISDTVDSGFIKRDDPESSSRKHAKYIPFWA